MTTPNLPPLPIHPRKMRPYDEYTPADMKAYALAAYRAGFDAALAEVVSHTEAMKQNKETA
jgi:hypothetical protein